MTKGISRKQRRLADQRPAKRVHGASALAQDAKNPVPAIPMVAKRSPLSAAVSGPLPPHTYPAKKIAQGKPQIAGVGKP